MTKVILIENNKGLKEGMIHKLTREGFQMVTKDADLYIMDLGLDSGICWDLIQSIRSKVDVPIIIHSGYGTSDFKKKAFELGCNGYINKPIPPDEFILEIRFILSAYELGKNMNK